MHFSASQLLTVVLAGLAVASPSPLKRRARSAVIGFRTVAKVRFPQYTTINARA